MVQPSNTVVAGQKEEAVPPEKDAPPPPPPAANVESAPSEKAAPSPPPPAANVEVAPPQKAAPPPPPPAVKAEAALPEKAASSAARPVPYLRCPYCGQTTPATEKLCPRCGRPLSAATPPPLGGTPPVPAARLVVRAGPERGKAYMLQAEVRVGRGAGNDIALSDPRASRRHGQITRQGNQYILVDLGSRYGTLVNNKRIEGGCVLKEGDVLTLGGTELVFHF